MFLKTVHKILMGTNSQEFYTKTLSIEYYNHRTKTFLSRMLTHVGIQKKPDGFTFGINDGRAAGRTIDHLHIHLISRFVGDVENPVGGVRNIIPKLGDYTR